MVVLLVIAAVSENKDAALGALPFLGAIAILSGSTDRGAQHRFAESVRKSRLKISPAQAAAGIFLGTLSLLIAARLLVWISGA
jgi:hypothetical protein